MTKSQPNSIVHALSGGLGGAAAMVVTYPLIAVSCHQQTNKKDTEEKVKQVKKEAELASEQDTLMDAEEVPKKSTTSTAVDLVKDIYKQDGILGFYSGLESAIYGIALTNFVYYYFYESTGRLLIKNRRLQKITDFSFKNLHRITLQGLTPLESIVTGTIAGSITALVANPLWVVNTRTTVSKTKKSFFGAIVDLYRTEGIKSFFNGLLPALLLVINPVIQYTVFEQIKNLLVKTKKRNLKPIDAFFIGALAKLIATGLTYPYITLKSRMHLAKNSTGEAPASMTALLLHIIKKEGLSVLYNGLFVKLSQSIFTAAFLFFFKEELVNLTVKLLVLIRKLKSKKLVK